MSWFLRNCCRLPACALPPTSPPAIRTLPPSLHAPCLLPALQPSDPTHQSWPTTKRAQNMVPWANQYSGHAHLQGGEGGGGHTGALPGGDLIAQHKACTGRRASSECSQGFSRGWLTHHVLTASVAASRGGGSTHLAFAAPLTMHSQQRQRRPGRRRCRGPAPGARSF